MGVRNSSAGCGRFARDRLLAACAFLGLAAAVPPALACACGCGVFDIGANSAFPTQSDTGFSAFLRVNLMDQNRNWEGNSSAPAADNPDKEIRTFFYTLGGQYMINRDWGVMVELPIFQRSFTSTGDGTAFPAGQIFTSKMTDLGDAMIQGVYTGFSPDMSTGVLFGLKLPTGNYTGPYEYPGQTGPGTTGGLAYDRDSLPGSGSTDLLLGAYHAGAVNASGSLSYFLQGKYDVPIMERAGATGTYRPGNELDLGAGLAYSFGPAGAFKSVSPVLQLIESIRDPDSGTGANPGNPNNSGYRRLLVAPGVDLRVDKFKFYLDASFPIVQHTNIDPNGLVDGNGSGQLVARVIYRMQIGYDF